MYEMKNLAGPQLEYLKRALRKPLAKRHYELTKLYVAQNTLHIVFQKADHPRYSHNYSSILLWQVERSNPKLNTTPHYQGFFTVNGDPKRRINARTIISTILKLLNPKQQRNELIDASLLASVDFTGGDYRDYHKNVGYVNRHVNDFMDTNDL